MATASVHDLKNDLKMLFVKRFLGHGFKLPVIFYSGALNHYRFPALSKYTPSSEWL